MHSILRSRTAFAACAILAVTAAATSASAQIAEARPQCRIVAGMSIVFAPGTPEWEIQDVLRTVQRHRYSELDFQIGGRWSGTSLGSTGSTGNAMAIRYSFVPDGTFVPNDGLGSGNSALTARMNSLFGGNTALWQSKLKQAVEVWGTFAGIDYQFNTDDGANFPNTGGSAARGDVRVAMIPFSNNNVLAYNYYPQFGGDMVINQNLNWASSGADYRFLRNTVAHEHGHGIGIAHVIPSNGTKLMEPALNTNFDGPQNDDIQAGQWLYGDWRENNNSNAARSDIGTVAHNQAVELLAVERSTNPDWYRIVIPAGNNLTVNVFPVGFTYNQGPQGGSSSPRNSLAILDLRIRAYESNGTTLLGTANNNGVGLSEQLANIPRPANGEISLLVDTVTSSVDIQRYRMTFQLVQANATVGPTVLNLVRGVLESGDLASLISSDNNRLVIKPGIVLNPSQSPIVFEVNSTSPILNPSHMTMGIEALMSTSSGFRTIELFNYDTNMWEQVHSGTVNTTETLVQVHLASNPGKYISAAGTIASRISYRVNGPALSVPVRASTDHIYWELTP